MKVLAVNLRRDIERRRRLEQVLESSPLRDVTFIEAVDAREMSEKERMAAFDYQRFADYHRVKPAPGEVGCTLSHRKCWAQIARGDEPVMIIEDDIYFDGPWGDILEQSAAWLGVHRPRVIVLPRHYFYRREWDMGQQKARGDLRFCYGTECYMINPEAARLLSADDRPYYLTDEWHTYARKGVEIIALYPHPVIHDDGVASNIALHAGEHHDWDGMRRSAQPDMTLFDHYRALVAMAQHRLGYTRLYDTTTCRR